MYNESHGEKCDASGGRAAPPLSLRHKDKELEQKQNGKLQDDEQLGKYNTLFQMLDTRLPPRSTSRLQWTLHCFVC